MMGRAYCFLAILEVALIKILHVDFIIFNASCDCSVFLVLFLVDTGEPESMHVNVCGTLPEVIPYELIHHCTA